MDEQDRQLDRLLRRHLAARLDPRLGVADRLPRMTLEPQRTRRARGWWIAGGAALAAGVALLLALRSALPGAGVAPPNGASPAAGAEAAVQTVASHAMVPVDRRITWDTVDEGTIYLESGVPMRSLRQVQLETARWLDPRTGSIVEVSVPQQQVVLVGMNRQ